MKESILAHAQYEWQDNVGLKETKAGFPDKWKAGIALATGDGISHVEEIHIPEKQCIIHLK